MPRTIRLAGMQLALVAMFLRALLPAGWMPDTEAHASAPLVICTINGPLLATPGDAASKHKPHHDDKSGSDICPFAASIHVTTPANAIAFTQPVPTDWARDKLFISKFTVDSDHYALQSPRGPPLFA